jgi:hypothetical protein
VREVVRQVVHELPQRSVAVDRRAKAYVCADADRMAASAALLRPLGDRMVLEFDRAHVITVEHMFPINERGGVSGNLDLLMAIAAAMPGLQFADFWHGYLRYLAAEVMLDRDRVRSS